MFKSFLTIALRFLWRRKTYTIFNFACLTFGLICAIITLLYILNIFSYDKFHKNYDRIYLVDAYVTYFNGDRFPKELLSASLTDVLKEHAPEIDQMTRVAEDERAVSYEDKKFPEKGFFADNNFLDVFSFPLVQSVKSNVLAEKNSIVISERMARKFFETTDCIGKTLILKEGDKDEAYKVTGVFRKIPAQSVLRFDFVIPFSNYITNNSWALETGATANRTWVTLKDNVEKKKVEEKIKDLIRNQETTLNQELFLFPLREQVLYSYASGRRVWKEMQNVAIIGTIGFAILLIACFNFMNLAIALNIRRYKETGIKKVAGSSKSSIVFQFLGETFIITFLSLLTAILLVSALLIGFNSMFNYDIHLRILDLRMIAFLICLTLFTSIVSGFFPALYLASSNPANALKGKIITGNSYSVFRQGLIIFQFTIPIVLIICLMIIKVQDSYMRNYDAGIEKDHVFILDNTPGIQSHSAIVKSELLAIPGIDVVSFTNCIPTRGTKVSSEVTWAGKEVSEKLHFWCINTDFDYNKAVNVNMIDGRFFNPSFATDSAAYLINNIAANVLKNKSPVGTSITLEGRKGTIIGVFKDFHSIDLAGPIVPTIIGIKPGDQPYVLIRFSSGSIKTLIDQIKTLYQRYESEVPFRVTLFRDLIPYSDLSLPSRLVGLAFVVALLLACMGLFGLASFTAENRTKEIGIRKANGATILSVMRLLLTSYTKWLTIAFFIALPVSFLIGNKFLGKFYFHAQIPLWAFIAGPLIACLVALLTVSSQTWRAASRNPVKALRYE